MRFYVEQARRRVDSRAVEPGENDDAIDPELRPIIIDQRARALARPSLEAVSPPEMRMRASAEFRSWNSDPDPAVATRDFYIGSLQVRLYTPPDKVGDGLLVYAHGGGWVIGDLDLEEAPLRRLARRSGVRVLSVDYRLAPEHPFPAPIEDLECVFDWVAETGAAELGLTATRIGLGGASAGANVALGTALRLRDRGLVPRILLLMYGAYGGGRETSSYLAFADGRFGLPRAAMDWFWRSYTGGRPAPYSVPLDADLRGLPAVFLHYAELDILRDDSLLLAERLRQAGVPVSATGYAGAVHGFTQYVKASSLARRALDEAGDALAAALG